MNENIDAKPAEEAYAGDMETTADATETTEAKLEEETGRNLTLRDRCDSCGAAAKGYATKGDFELLFCGHHFHKHEAALGEQGFEVFYVEEPVLA